MATDDIVRVKIEVDDQIRGLVGAQRQISNLQRLGTAVGRGIGGAIAGGFAVAAGMAGVGLLSRGIIGIQNEVKDTEVGIASLISALTGQDITASLGRAKTIVGDLKEDAAKGAGELHHYATGFQRILGPARAAQASLKEVRELNRVALAAGFAMRGAEGLLLAPMDVMQALTAGVGERTTPLVNTLLGAIKMTNKEFNALAKRDRFDALMKAFGTMSGGADLMGKTFSAQTATLKDGVKDIIRNVTAPVFQLWTEQLEAANDWMTKNKENMREMAEDYGPKLAQLWKDISSNPGAAAGGLGAVALAPGVGRFAGAGGLSAAGGMVGGGALAGGGVVAGVLALLAVGFVAVKGAIMEYPALLESIGAAGTILAVAFGKLFSALGALVQKGSILNTLGGGIIMVFVTAVDLFARGIMVVAAGVKALGSSLVATRHLFEGIALAATGQFGLAGKSFAAHQDVSKNALSILAQDIKDALTKPIRTTKVRTSKNDDEGGGLDKPFGGDTHIGKVEVIVQTEVNEDPNRVAVAMEEVFSRLDTYRRQARASPLSPKTI